MRILIITPKLPYPASGADEQDRFYGIKLLKEMGHDVSVIAKVRTFQTKKLAGDMAAALGVSVTMVPYTTSKPITRFLNPYFIDGAAFEYLDPVLQGEIDAYCAIKKPDVVWVDGSYAWPIAEYVKNKGIRTIIRSLNIESRHILSDEGWTPLNMLRAFSKDLGERSLNKRADVVFAITETEKELYRKRGVISEVLPLRSLPYILEEAAHVPKETNTLKVVYSGSTYSVGHNKKSAEFIVRNVAPKALKVFGKSVLFHITGAKLPKELAANLGENVKYEGYVDDYAAFLLRADVVLSPSLGGAGMQQKIFEPIARGIPTITSSRGLAGYDFRNNQHVLIADSVEEVLEKLSSLKDFAYRKQIGENGRKQAQRLFSRERIQHVLKKEI